MMDEPPLTTQEVIDFYENQGYRGALHHKKVQEESKWINSQRHALKHVPIAGMVRAPCTLITTHVPIVGCELGLFPSQAPEPDPPRIKRSPVTGRGYDPINNPLTSEEFRQLCQKERDARIDAVIQQQNDYYFIRPTVRKP